MKFLPLNSVPSQVISANLNNQLCQIKVYQKYSGLYLDLYINNALVLGGVICQNLNRIVRDAYLGFQGDLCFLDNHGFEDPDYTRLGPVNDYTSSNGARFILIYLEPADLAAAGFSG